MQHTKPKRTNKKILAAKFGNAEHERILLRRKFSNNTFGFKPLDCLLSLVGRIIRKFNQITKGVAE